MDIMPGNFTRMIFDRFDLPMPVLREEVIVAAALEAVAHTYTTCFSECCYHVVFGVHMDLLSHAPLERLYVWEARFFSCFSLESSGW
jgi:hypothetical protein